MWSAGHLGVDSGHFTFDRPVEVAEAIRRVLAADRTNERPSSQCGKPHEHGNGAS